MAGYIIHLAVGEEYNRNFPDQIKNHKEFLKGIIYPDLNKEYLKTHYGPKSSQVNLKHFFYERDLDTDFTKGYFLHLVTDYLFYNKFLKKFSKKDIYTDYDITNMALKNEFKVEIPEEIADMIFFKTGDTKIIDLEETKEFIRKTSKYNLEDIKSSVLKDDPFWLTIRPLSEIKVK